MLVLSRGTEAMMDKAIRKSILRQFEKRAKSLEIPMRSRREMFDLYIQRKEVYEQIKRDAEKETENETM